MTSSLAAEFATLTYINWCNHRRLHGQITDDNTFTAPAVHEASRYRQTPTALQAATQQPQQSPDSERFTAAIDVGRLLLVAR